MRSILLCMLYSFSFSISYAQAKINKDLLLVRIYQKSDWTRERDYFFIQADEGVSSAAGIYALKPVNGLTGFKKSKEILNSINKDSVEYNYFTSESAALNFVESKGWTLFFTLTEIKTTNDISAVSGTLGNYSNVYSVFKYLFRRND